MEMKQQGNRLIRLNHKPRPRQPVQRRPRRKRARTHAHARARTLTQHAWMEKTGSAELHVCCEKLKGNCSQTQTAETRPPWYCQQEADDASGLGGAFMVLLLGLQHETQSVQWSLQCRKLISLNSHWIISCPSQDFYKWPSSGTEMRQRPVLLEQIHEGLRF